MKPVERGRMVKNIGDYLLENIDEIAPDFTTYEPRGVSAQIIP